MGVQSILRSECLLLFVFARSRMKYYWKSILGLALADRRNAPLIAFMPRPARIYCIGVKQYTVLSLLFEEQLRILGMQIRSVWAYTHPYRYNIDVGPRQVTSYRTQPSLPEALNEIGPAQRFGLEVVSMTFISVSVGCQECCYWIRPFR